MIIQSDWHIHTECSYDASLTLTEIAKKAEEYGFKKIGITDHINFNDNKFLKDMENSANSVKKFSKTHPGVLLGAELTPIEKPEFDYISKTGTREGYIAPSMNKPFDIELAQTKEELMQHGIRYAIGASHWRVDVPGGRRLLSDTDDLIKEWYRQQMWLACDERVTILGHPWWSSSGAWYDDFSRIPRSMNEDIAAALKENKKFVECNGDMLCSPKMGDKFRRQYIEFIRELFEKGIPVTYGSDSHDEYSLCHNRIENLLKEAGFKEGDFSELSEEYLW